jgi:hypothetical protein
MEGLSGRKLRTALAVSRFTAEIAEIAEDTEMGWGEEAAETGRIRRR